MQNRYAHFDWNQARAFLMAAELGSFSAAALALGQSQPTISRQVAALEARLGVTLYERVGRKLSLTETGRELATKARAMASAADEIALAASGQSQQVEGHICISASEVMATLFLPEVLAKLRKIAPGIIVEVLVSNEISDLKRREADIALRHIRPEQPDLYAKLLGESDARIYGTAALIESLAPLDAQKLSSADFLSYGDAKSMLTYLNPLGLSLREENVKFICENGLAALQIIQRGLCFGVLTERMAAQTQDLHVALPSLAPLRFPTWLVTHRELHTSKRIRIVFDLLSNSFGGNNRI